MDSHTRGDDPDRRIETEPREVAARAEERDATPDNRMRYLHEKITIGRKRGR